MRSSYAGSATCVSCRIALREHSQENRQRETIAKQWWEEINETSNVCGRLRGMHQLRGTAAPCRHCPGRYLSKQGDPRHLQLPAWQWLGYCGSLLLPTAR